MLDILLYSHLVVGQKYASLMLHNHIHYNLLVCLDILHGTHQTKDHFEKYLLHTIRSNGYMKLYLVFEHMDHPCYT